MLFPLAPISSLFLKLDYLKKGIGDFYRCPFEPFGRECVLFYEITQKAISWQILKRAED